MAPPATWGRISGTVRTTVDRVAVPPAGATVEVDSKSVRYTLTTGKDGTYALWLDRRDSPLTVAVAKDGHEPVVATVKVVKGKTVVTDLTVNKAWHRNARGPRRTGAPGASRGTRAASAGYIFGHWAAPGRFGRPCGG